MTLSPIELFTRAGRAGDRLFLPLPRAWSIKALKNKNTIQFVPVPQVKGMKYLQREVQKTWKWCLVACPVQYLTENRRGAVTRGLCIIITLDDWFPVSWLTITPSNGPVCYSGFLGCFWSGGQTFITCSAVILYADWSIDVRPGAVHTL